MAAPAGRRLSALGGAAPDLSRLRLARDRMDRASGAEVLQEPMDQPYGVRDCAFRDPAGNMLRLSQPR